MICDIEGDTEFLKTVRAQEACYFDEAFQRTGSIYH
jgi:hypothetical protein